MTSSLLTGPLTGLDAEALPASHGAEFDFGRYRHTLDDIDTFRCAGKVVQVIGLTVEAEGLVCEVGEICEVHPARGGEAIIAEVVGFRGDRVVLMPLGEMSGISPGSTVVATGGGFSWYSVRPLSGVSSMVWGGRSMARVRSAGDASGLETPRRQPCHVRVSPNRCQRG